MHRSPILFYKCAVADCGPLLSVRNGRVMFEDTLYEDVATYSCNTGFRITAGNIERICGATGSWSGQAPTCSTFLAL